MVSSSSDLTTSTHERWLLKQESNGAIRILQANDNSVHLGMKISECLMHAEYYENAWSEDITIKDFKDMPIADVLDFLNNSEFSIVRFYCDGFAKHSAPKPEKKSHKSKQWKPYKQEWSLKCSYCGCLHLKSATAGELRRCCLNGEIDEYP